MVPARSVLVFLLLHILPPGLTFYNYDYNYYEYPEDTTPATDCSYQISSRVSKNGTFTSPMFPRPYPDNTACAWKFRGEGRERVQIVFEKFDVYFDALSNSEIICHNSDDVTITTLIQHVQNNVKEKENKWHNIGKFCGNVLPHSVMSSDTSLDIKLNSLHHRQPNVNTGFKATYNFVTDFGIKTGQPDPGQVCGFVFNSSEATNGTVTSPNFPGYYPKNTECHYTFHGNSEETVDITFPFFDVEGVHPHCDAKTRSDFLEFSNFEEIRDRKMYRFCGVDESGNTRRVSSDHNYFRIMFKSNDVYDGQGFQALYQFRKEAYQNGDAIVTPLTQGGSNASTNQSALYPLVLLFLYLLTQAL